MWWYHLKKITEEVAKVTNHHRLWDTELASYFPSATHRICFYSPEIHGFNLPDLAWSCSFQITHGVKQCTACQRTINYDITKHNEYLPWLERLQSCDIRDVN